MGYHFRFSLPPVSWSRNSIRTKDYFYFPSPSSFFSLLRPTLISYCRTDLKYPIFPFLSPPPAQYHLVPFPFFFSPSPFFPECTESKRFFPFLFGRIFKPWFVFLLLVSALVRNNRTLFPFSALWIEYKMNLSPSPSPL